MSFLLYAQGPSAARRAFLGKSGLILSGAAVALLAGNEALAKTSKSAASDLRVLNTALGAEPKATEVRIMHSVHSLELP